jgi:hypothetical protein
MRATVTASVRYVVGLISTAAIMLGPHALAQISAANSPTGFPPLDQWKAAILAVGAASLEALYSTNPPAEVQANGVAAGADADVKFWLGLKARSLKLEIVQMQEHGYSRLLQVCSTIPSAKTEGALQYQASYAPDQKIAFLSPPVDHYWNLRCPLFPVGKRSPGAGCSEHRGQ